MPPEASSPRVSIDVLASKIEGLSADVNEVMAALKEINSNLQKLVNAQTDSSARLAALESWRSTFEKFSETSRDDRAVLTRRIDKLETELNLMKWIGGPAVTGTVAWITAHLLGLIK